MKAVGTDQQLKCFFPQLLFDMDKEIFPMVVQAVVDEGEGEMFYHAIGPMGESSQNGE